MGHRRVLAITVLPLLFLTVVTFAAGWMKIASPDPRIGFLANAAALQALKNSSPAVLAQIFNARLDAAVTGTFLLLVAVIVAGSVRAWWQFLVGSRPIVLHEVGFAEAEASPS